jgi:hypothetical protein
LGIAGARDAVDVFRTPLKRFCSIGERTGIKIVGG